MSVDVAERLSTLALEMALADSRSQGLLSDRRRVARALRGVIIIMPDLPPGPMTPADGQASGDGQSNITLSDAEGRDNARRAAAMGGNLVASVAACAAPERGDMCAATRAASIVGLHPNLPNRGRCAYAYLCAARYVHV
jgi:hypothetical protein